MKSGSTKCLKKGLEEIFTLTAPDGMSSKYCPVLVLHFYIFFSNSDFMVLIYSSSAVQDRGAGHRVQRGL